jgi:TP901 family phage tail tape measure protein
MAVANIQITAGTAGLASGLRSAAGMIRGFASSAGQQIKNGIGAPRRLMGLATDFAAIGLAMRGLDRLSQQGKNFLEFDDALTRFGIATRSTPEQLQAVGKAARDTSSAVGLDAREVLAAGRAYVDLAGGANFTLNKMRVLAAAARASGSDTKDMAGMMYQLTRSMKVTDAQMEDTIGGLINQAKDGAIEAAQMSREFAGMMPVFARFGVIGREGAVQLGAMYQVTRDGFDSAAEAATGMLRLMSGMQRHADKFAKAGVQVFKKGSKSELREISAIMDDISKSPLAHDTQALIKAFGRSEAWRTYQLIAESVPRLKELEAAGRANGVVQQDLATIAESATGRMNRAFETAKNTIAEAFTKDRLDGFLAGLEGILSKVDAIGSAVGAVADGMGVMFRLGKRIRGALSDNENQNPWRNSEAEDRIKQAMAEEESIRGKPWRGRYKGTGMDRIQPGDIRKAELDRENRKGYDRTAAVIKRAEHGDDKPTRESIEAAVQAQRADPNSRGATGEVSAATRYLENSGMSKAKVDEIVKAMDAKATAAIIGPHLDALGDKIVAALEKATAPNAHQQAIALQHSIESGRGSARALAGRISVNFDGNEAKRSTANATDRRRKP